MADALIDLEPRLLWSYFLALEQIPRGSKAEAAAAAWVAEQGRILGCEVEQDAAGNVLIRKQAAPGQERRPCVALQAHVDMVCEKNEGTVHDFQKDPIQVIREGDWVRADGTTLGADNGIGVAAALAALADPSLVHGPLEVLVTVDEETGLTGAGALRPGWLHAKYLLNLDSEEEGVLTIGCAGGVDSLGRKSLAWVPPSPEKRPYRLLVSGLKGGHSGMDIHAGRANAIRLMAQGLRCLMPFLNLELACLRGGNKRNAIPRECVAVVYMDPAREGDLAQRMGELLKAWQDAFGIWEPTLAWTWSAAEAAPVLDAREAETLVDLLLVLPHGVEAMNPAIPGLVQTSTNLAVVDTRNGVAAIDMLSRSSLGSSRKALVDRIQAAFRFAGYTCVQEGEYPGWKPEPQAELVRWVDAVHRELAGKPMSIQAIHAGLECGLIGEKYPEMEMASLGPDMWDVHTPDERVSLSSVARFWILLKAVLERI